MVDNPKKDQQANLSNPVLPTPVITYGMVHKLTCKQERQVTVSS